MYEEKLSFAEELFNAYTESRKSSREEKEIVLIYVKKELMSQAKNGADAIYTSKLAENVRNTLYDSYSEEKVRSTAFPDAFSNAVSAVVSEGVKIHNKASSASYLTWTKS